MYDKKKTPMNLGFQKLRSSGKLRASLKILFLQFKPIIKGNICIFQPGSDKGDTTTFYQWIVFVLVISGGKFQTNFSKHFVISKNLKIFYLLKVSKDAKIDKKAYEVISVPFLCPLSQRPHFLAQARFFRGRRIGRVSFLRN